MMSTNLKSMENNKYMRFFISTNGCIRRKIDAQHAVDFLTYNGLKEVENIENADIILFFSCAADNVPEAIAREAIQDLDQRRNPKTKIIVGGCLPSIVPDFLNSFENIETLRPAEINRLEELINKGEDQFKKVPVPTKVCESILAERGLRLTKKKFKGIPDNGVDEQDLTNIPSFSIAATQYDEFRGESDILRISSGCLSKCAYCCIRAATGRLKSRTPIDVMEELNSIMVKGQSKFTLTAEDVGAYGLDIGTNISKLLAKIFSESPEVELSIMTLNPRWVMPQIDALISVIKDGLKVRHVRVPIQAASNRLLKSMNRGYCVADVERIFDSLQELGVQLHSHLIVGFPGELKSEVDDMIRFIQCYPNVDYHIYSYNDRPGAISTKYPDKINTQEAQSRYNAVLLARELTLTTKNITQ